MTDRETQRWQQNGGAGVFDELLDKHKISAPAHRALVFDELLDKLPGALQAKDRYGIVARLEGFGLRPLAAQNVEHMLRVSQAGLA